MCIVVSCLVCIFVVVCIDVSCLVCIVVVVCIVVSCLVCIVVSCLGCIVVSCVYLLYYVCIAVFNLDAGLLEGPATGHFDTGFSWFPCVYKQRLRWFPTFQVATTCFSCSPPDLNLLLTNFIFCIHVK